MKRAVIVLCLVASATTHASAEEAKSLTTARALSGVGTGVSGALFLSSFLAVDNNGEVNMPLMFTGLGTGVFTPALGQWYAGRFLTPGMAIRIGAGTIATYAVLGQSDTVRCNHTTEYTECKSVNGTGVILLGIAAIVFVGGAALDFKELPDTIERTNRTRGHFSIAPMIVPSRTGDPVIGLSLTGEL